MNFKKVIECQKNTLGSRDQKSPKSGVTESLFTRKFNFPAKRLNLAYSMLSGFI